jgi:hypothetical protein
MQKSAHAKISTCKNQHMQKSQNECSPQQPKWFRANCWTCDIHWIHSQFGFNIFFPKHYGTHAANSKSCLKILQN